MHRFIGSTSVLADICPVDGKLDDVLRSLASLAAGVEQIQ